MFAFGNILHVDVPLINSFFPSRCAIILVLKFLPFDSLVYILCITCVNCGSGFPSSAIIIVFTFGDILHVDIPLINSFSSSRCAIILVLKISTM